MISQPHDSGIWGTVVSESIINSAVKHHSPKPGREIVFVPDVSGVAGIAHTNMVRVLSLHTTPGELSCRTNQHNHPIPFQNSHIQRSVGKPDEKFIRRAIRACKEEVALLTIRECKHFGAKFIYLIEFCDISWIFRRFIHRFVTLRLPLSGVC